MADTLEIFGTEYTGVTGIIATNDQSTDLTYIRPQGTKSITQNGTGIDVAEYASIDVNVSGGGQPNLQAKTYTVSSAGTATVTADSGYDGLSSVAVSVPQGEMHANYRALYKTVSNVRKWEFTPIAEVVIGDDYGTPGFIDDETIEYGNSVTYNAIAKNTSITPTESSQTIGGADTMMEGAVTVGAISSTYVGSGITRRSSTDLTASGATVTVPSGYYSAQATKSVASGTAGTPTATKVVDTDDASALITPSVTNTSGYITGGTKTGTAVLVSARELVDGKTITCDDAGNWDVAEVETLVVPSGTAGTPTATKGTVSNHQVSVTPSVTNTSGYITGSTKTGTAATVSASELVSGTLSLSANGTSDCTNYASVNVNIPFVTYYTGSSTPSSSLGSDGDIYLKTV